MADDYTEHESVRKHLPRLAAQASEFIALGAAASLRYMTRETESPIEAIFALWWHTLYPLVDPSLKLALHAQFGFAPINGRNYRADFVLWPRDLHILSIHTARGASFAPIVIELDGHDFHERTKDQVAARNQRDRDFQEKKYRVLHFSGSEIHRDPGKVFNDVLIAGGDAWAAYQESIHAHPPQAGPVSGVGPD